MIPDIEVQLQVIIKSLKDNIVPAIDSENELAQQQIQLSLAALDITLGNLPLVHCAIRRDLQSHSKIAGQLIELLVDRASKDSLTAAMNAANEALENPEKGFIQLQQQARLLRDVIGTAITVNSMGDQAEAVEKLVLDTSETTLMLGRAWNKPMGFEPDPDAVEELSDQLGLSG